MCIRDSDISARARLSDVDQERLTGPTAAPRHPGPPTGRKVGKQESQGLEGRRGRKQGVVL
eukprot:557715-Alexandrium_andersonii.AAC.1